MNARALNVLHHRSNDHVGAIGECVDIRLECIFEELVDEHGPVFAHARCAFEVATQRFSVVHNLHRAPTEHIRRAHEHRIPDAVSDLHGLIDAGGRSIGRLGDAEFAHDCFEATPILGDVDGIR